MKRPFTMFRRARKSGRPVWYFQTYDEYGRRTTARSTGHTNRAAAEHYVAEVLNAGIHTRPEIRFAAYAESWWDWDRCDYVGAKLARGSRISRTHAHNQRHLLVHQLVPYFGGHLLHAITAPMIENWVLEMKRNSGLSAATVNRALNCLKVMLKQAVVRGLLTASPAQHIARLPEPHRARVLLSSREMRALLDESSLDAVWDGDVRHFTLSLLAASTGMRLGECQGLPWRCVHDGYVDITQSWKPRHGLLDPTPKWGSERIAPIPSRTQHWLGELMALSPYREPNDLVFFGVSGQRPVDQKTVAEALYVALARIGIAEGERRERGLTFHGWRHWFNSHMRAAAVSDAKLRRVTGHKSGAMTEHYTHFALEQLSDVAAAQEELFR